MNWFQILAIIVFVVSSSAANIGFTQKRMSPDYRIGLFRDKLLGDLIYLPASLLFIASGIYLGISSWRLLLIVAVVTAVLTPIVINRIVLNLIIMPISKFIFKRLYK